MRSMFAQIAARPLYVCLSAVIALIAAAGFVPLAIHQIVTHDLPRDVIIHVHAVIYAIWLGLFFLQTVFAATGRMIFHRRLGKWLIGYALLMYVAGMAVTINRFAKTVHSGDLSAAQQVNFAAFTDMIAFPIVFGFAIYFIRRPEVHKRLMVVTSTMILYAAMVRIDFPPIPHFNYVLFMFVWCLPLMIGMGNDLISRRLVHPAYVTGVLILFLLSMRPLFSTSQPWLVASRWLASVV